MATLTETSQKPHIQPDISYFPDHDKYAQRTKRRVENEKLHLTELPVGFPQELVSTFVWEGHDFAKKDNYVYTLSEQEVVEIETALEYFKCRAQSTCSLQQQQELT